MSSVGGTGVDAAVADVARLLSAYVAVARGVRAEFSPEQADLDPRVEVAARELGLALGRFEDSFETELGFVPDVGVAWEGVQDGEDDDPAQEPVELLVDEFSVGMLVGVVDGTSPDALDAVLPIVDDDLHQLVHRLGEQGFLVTEAYVSRGSDTDGEQAR